MPKFTMETYSLPPGSRRPSQWEFDKYCYENPDPRYPLDINALVYKTYLSKIIFKISTYF